MQTIDLPLCGFGKTDWGCLRTGCWGEYLDLRGMKWQEDGENCIYSVTMGWDCVSVELRPLTGPFSIPQMIHEWIWSSGGMILTGENRRTRRKTCPSVTLTWKRTRAIALRSRWLTAWATARPRKLHNEKLHNLYSSPNIIRVNT
jgi:hypothetical protein